MKIHVKNMVCPRCISAVKNILTQNNIPFEAVLLGEISTSESLNTTQIQKLKSALELEGFQWIESPEEILVAKTVGIISEIIQSEDIEKIQNLYQNIGQQLGEDVAYVSRIFSSIKKISLQHYILMQKIEKTKSLLKEQQLSLKEIAYLLHFSHPAHLSAQFKNITGISPSQYKNQRQLPMISLDSL